MKQIITTLAIGMLLSFYGIAQKNPYEMAWDAFKINDLESAKTHFLKATELNPPVAEAWLMLSIISNIYEDDNKSFEYFKKFSEHCEDIVPFVSAHFYPKILGYRATKKSPQVVAYMNSLIADGNLDLRTLGILNEALAGHYFASNQIKISNEYRNQIGNVTEWSIAGVFENISESGFDKNWAPITNPQDNSVFRDKFNREVKWFRMVQNVPGKWNDHTNNLPTTSSIVFSQTFCESKTEQDVLLRIGTSGSLKVWVNDKLLFSEVEERNNGMDTYLITARLNQGFNRILLQTGSDVINNHNIMLRISDHNESLLTNLRFKATYEEYVTDISDFESKHIELYPETYFKNRIAANTDDLLAYMMLARMYLANDKKDMAFNLIAEAQQIAPDCSFLANQFLEACYRYQSYTMATRLVEELKIKDSMNPESLYYAYNEAVKKNDYVLAVSILRKIEGLTGENERLLLRRINLAIRMEATHEVEHYINRAYRKFPDNSEFVELKVKLETERNNYKRVERILNLYLKSNYDAGLAFQYAVALVRRGNGSKAMHVLKERTTMEPDRIEHYITLGYVNDIHGNYVAAAGYYQTCQSFAPYSASYYEKEGYSWEKNRQRTRNTVSNPNQYIFIPSTTASRNDPSLASFQKALELNPSEHDLREKIQKMRNEKSLRSYFEKPDLDAIVQNSLEHQAAQYPNEDCLILLNERQIVVYPNGAAIERNYILMKVFNSSGVDRLKEYSISYKGNQYLEIEGAEIIKPGGQRIQAKRNSNELVFTTLESGDVISVIYTIETYSNGTVLSNFNDYFYFSTIHPALNFRYRLIKPLNMSMHHVLTRSDIEPIVTVPVHGYRMYTWEAKNVPAVKIDQSSPHINDIAQVLKLSLIENWSDIAGRILDFTHNTTRPDYFVRQISKEIFNDVSDTISDYEKVNLIYNYVTNNVNYIYKNWLQDGLIPQMASEVHARGMGDCKDATALFIALCNTVGIKANFLILATRESGREYFEVPKFRFNHAMAKVTIDDKDYYVELTNPYLPFASLPKSTTGSFAMDLDPETINDAEPFYLYPATRLPNKIIRIKELSIVDDKLVANLWTLRNGASGMGMRYWYSGKTEEEQFRMMEETIQSDIVNAKLISHVFNSSLSNMTDSLDYNYKYTFDAGITRIADMLIYEFPFTDNLDRSAVPAANGRSRVINLLNTNWAYEQISETIVVNIPKGKKIVEIPSDIQMQSECISFSLTFKLVENQLYIIREIDVPVSLVMPDQTQEYRDILNTLLRNAKPVIAFIDSK